MKNTSFFRTALTAILLLCVSVSVFGQTPTISWKQPLIRQSNSSRIIPSGESLLPNTDYFIILEANQPVPNNLAAYIINNADGIASSVPTGVDVSANTGYRREILITTASGVDFISPIYISISGSVYTGNDPATGQPTYTSTRRTQFLVPN